MPKHRDRRATPPGAKIDPPRRGRPGRITILVLLEFGPQPRTDGDFRGLCEAAAG